MFVEGSSMPNTTQPERLFRTLYPALCQLALNMVAKKEMAVVNTAASSHALQGLNADSMGAEV